MNADLDEQQLELLKCCGKLGQIVERDVLGELGRTVEDGDVLKVRFLVEESEFERCNVLFT